MARRPVELHALTQALMVAHHALVDAHQASGETRPLFTIPLAECGPALRAAAVAFGDAATAWVVAGGPDRNVRSTKVRNYLWGVWKHAERNPAALRAIHRAKGARAFEGLPSDVQAELELLKPEQIAHLARLQEHLVRSGVMVAFRKSLAGIAPHQLDPMALAIGGLDLERAPDLLNNWLVAIQVVAASEAPIDVVVHTWSYLGQTLQLLLRERGRPLRSQWLGGELDSFVLLGPEGVAFNLHAAFPGVTAPRHAAVQRAFYDVLVVLFEAPPVEES